MQTSFFRTFFPYVGLPIVMIILCMACSKYDVPRNLDHWRSETRAMLKSAEITVKSGETWFADGRYKNFTLRGQAFSEKGAEAVLMFHSDGQSGYEVLFHNGCIDGTRKTGSLSAVRNLYRSLVEDGQWFNFEVAVRGKNIAVSINNTDVVCYTEPENPYRIAEHARQLLGEGFILFKGKTGNVKFRNMTVTPLRDEVRNECDTMPVIDEQTDDIIRLQQQNFPVIDYHVHLKGGLTKEMAHAMSMNYGINYGVAPNAGEGGIGRMLATDREVYEYFDEVKPLPFLCGVQGEGRRWSTQFSQEALGIFDYLFTDAMTIVDHRGRISRIYRPEEVIRDGGISMEKYMDLIVDQTVKILTNEPADIYANPTYIPDDMNAEYDKYWTDERINRVLDVLQQYQIALEINPRYLIPSMKIIKMAKARGLKFTFGTNNADADFGRLEYAIQAIKECGITAADIWFPSMSTRKARPVVDYNHFGTTKK